MIKLAAKGEITGFPDFKKSWNHNISEMNSRLAKSPVSKHLVPLEKTVFKYSEKKHACWDTIQRIISSREWNEKPGDLGQGKNEIIVSTPGKEIFGFIDEYRVTPGGIQLIDYKSGSAIQLDDPAKPVKKEYVIQLEFYAALFFYSFGEWPISPLLIIETGGKEIEIPYTMQDALSLVESAKKMMKTVNEKIEKNFPDPDFLATKLSNPCPESCKFCSYRPCCDPYWTKRELSYLNDWPTDTRGKITRVQEQRNGLLSVEIAGSRSGDRVNIRGLTPSRHCPLETGNNYIICNLVKEPGDGNFKEGILTTIYPL